MTTHRFAAIGFDLDGTLLDTVPDIAAAVDHALAQDGRTPLGEARVRRMVGGGLRHLMAQAMAATGGGSEADLDRLEACQATRYAGHLAERTRPYPGAVAALDALAAGGARLGLVTNKRGAFAKDLLRAFGIADRFASVLGGDALPGRGKPHPDALLRMVAECGGGATAFVGDSRYDVLAAHAAGMPVVVCRHGYRDEPIEAIGADAVIDGFDQLLPALERL